MMLMFMLAARDAAMEPFWKAFNPDDVETQVYQFLEKVISEEINQRVIACDIYIAGGRVLSNAKFDVLCHQDEVRVIYRTLPKM